MKPSLFNLATILNYLKKSNYGKMDFFRAFGTVSEKMKQDLETIREAIRHSPTKGIQFEGIFKEFLKGYLPKTLDVSTGSIIDSDGNQSRQCDIIISDSAKTPIFYEKEGIRTVPVVCIRSHRNKGAFR